RIRNDFGSFYSLGFSPAHQRDGKLHGLQVRIKGRDGLKLRYREAYQDRSGEQRMTAATMSALVLGVAENPLGVQLDFDRATSATSTRRCTPPSCRGSSARGSMANRTLARRAAGHATLLALLPAAAGAAAGLTSIPAPQQAPPVLVTPGTSVTFAPPGPSIVP